MQILLLCVALHGLALADESAQKPAAPPWTGPLEAYGSYGPSQYGASKPAATPVSLAQPLEHDPFAREVRLDPVDASGLLAEDLANRGLEKRQRIGVSRALQVGVEDGQWNALPSGGGVWTVAVVAEGATGIRLHFSNYDLPEGAAVRIVSPLQIAAVDGPFERSGPFADGAFWSTVVPGEEAYLEYYDPAAGAAPPASLPFVLDRIQHHYRDMTGSPCWPAEGNCHNDVTCNPLWSDVKDSVARFGFVDDDSFSCTGQLITTESPDQTPYFLTAAHCVSTEEQARTMVYHWQYQTAVCNGPPPDIMTVPSNSVGELLITDPQSDTSLIMVKGELPPGLFWAGWNAQPVSDGTPCSCIHHPCGSHKRISWGLKNGGQYGRLRIDWYSGVTEPGSSGGGAFLDLSRQLVGVLSQGPSACDAVPEEMYDEFGAFEYFYQFPGVALLLQAGSDDAWEPNADCASAPLIAPGTYNGLVLKIGDEDWYRVRSTSCGELEVALLFNDAYGDIDMELYDACGGIVLAESRGAGNTEWLAYSPGVGEEYWLRVYLNSNPRNTYDMTITLDGVNVRYAIPAGLDIPDNNTNGISHSFVVTDDFVIQDLNLGLHIPHTWNGDLVVTLSHLGTTGTLINRPGRPPTLFGFDNDGFEVILDDPATYAIEDYDSGGPMVVGTFRPQNGALTLFNGQNVQGLWTLQVSDHAGQDTGRLEAWTLYVTREPPPGGPCECGGDGDTDGDDDTDLADVAVFQCCVTAPGAGPLATGCEDLDFDCDAKVDQDDWAQLVNVLTGPRQRGIGVSDPQSPAPGQVARP